MKKVFLVFGLFNFLQPYGLPQFKALSFVKKAQVVFAELESKGLALEADALSLALCNRFFDLWTKYQEHSCSKYAVASFIEVFATLRREGSYAQRKQAVLEHLSEIQKMINANNAVSARQQFDLSDLLKKECVDPLDSELVSIFFKHIYVKRSRR